MFNYNELALFAGAGGGILGGALLGWTTIAACEIEPYPREILLARQRDGILPHFPIWDDVRTFDGKPWRGLVDVVSGGFPCQDISIAGGGAGINGKRSGLWAEMLRIIREVRPLYAFMENSPLLTKRGLGTVLADLAQAGYNAEWLCLSAAEVGAPHKRERMWILAKDNLAHTHRHGRNEDSFLDAVLHQALPETPECQPDRTSGLQRVLPYTDLSGTGRRLALQREAEKSRPAERASNDWWKTEPNVGRVADGVASRVDRLKAIGNGQVPLVAATAFRILHHRLNQH